MPSTIIEKVKETVFQALDALHIQNSAGHAEFHVDENRGVRISEIGVRMGGDCIGSDLVFLSTGHDFVKMVIDVACDKAPQLCDTPQQRHAEIRFLFDRDDVIVFEQMKSEGNHNVYHVSDFDFSNEGRVSDSSTRIGYYILLD